MKLSGETPSRKAGRFRFVKKTTEQRRNVNERERLAERAQRTLRNMTTTRHEWHHDHSFDRISANFRPFAVNESAKSIYLARSID